MKPITETLAEMRGRIWRYRDPRTYEFGSYDAYANEVDRLRKEQERLIKAVERAVVGLEKFAEGCDPANGYEALDDIVRILVGEM